ncbi:unnamed protein product, partial [Ilex paraguariensis]
HPTRKGVAAGKHLSPLGVDLTGFNIKENLSLGIVVGSRCLQHGENGRKLKERNQRMRLANKEKSTQA